MKLKISFSGMKHTESLDERIEEKSSKLSKYFDGTWNMTWNCYVEGDWHYSDVSIQSANIHYHAKGKSDNLYKTIDKVIAKFEKQLARKKDKFKNKIHRKGHVQVIPDPDTVWNDYDEEVA